MRRRTVLVLCALVTAAVIGVAGYPVYVSPQTDALRAADAILVVGGDAPEPRYEYGRAIARQGWAPHLVLSNPGGQVDHACAAAEPGFTVECFRPDPPTTLGEARMLRQLADERGWRTVIVVTYTPHVSRARYIMQKCFDGQLIMVAAPSRLSVLYWAWMYAYQSAGYLKAVAQGDC